MNLTPRTIGLLILLVFCLFMGVTAISMGFGAIFPALNLVARPFVCPEGTMDNERQVHKPYPGKAVTTQNWYCIDEQTGEKTRLSLFPISMIAGFIYGLGLFGIVYGIGAFRRRNV